MAEAIAPQSTIAVVGAGTMGAGIAQVAAAAGHPVLLHDVRPDAVERAIEGIGQNLQKLVAKCKLSAQAAADARVSPAASIEELALAHLVIEAVVEELQAKQKVFGKLESIVSSDCILATNTSSISITAIGAHLNHPQRLAGMHFFNPAPLMELVEVVSGLATSRDCSETVFATATAWGKTPVHVKSSPGFIVNRVARPFYAEALKLLQEGAATPASIDAILRESGGFRMGPFELMDLIGNDINFAVTKSVFEAYFFDRRFAPSLLQQELVEAGRFGRKAGRGWYEYGENTTNTGPHTEPRVDEKLDGSEVRQALAEAGEYKTKAVTICVTDGATATVRASRGTRSPSTVLVDLALDYLIAKRVAVAKAHQCNDDAYHYAVALLQAAGFSVTRVRDLPGMIVFRTVAMLINEAADTANQRICGVDALNTAMRKGVNYPLGPLEWADRIGIGKIWAGLQNIRQHYQEERYRVSPLLAELMTCCLKFEEWRHY